MAARKTKKVETEEKKPISNIEMLKAEMLKASRGVSLMSLENEVPGEWITSPAYDLNRILSGSLFKSVQIKNHIGIVGPEACLDENTHIHFETWVNDEMVDNKGGTIKTLYEKFHNKNNQLKIKSIDKNDQIFSQNIIDVVKTGTKKCFLLTTMNGYQITASEDHKFYIGNQNFLPLKELTTDNSVYIAIPTINNSIHSDKIKSIKCIGDKETYDIKCLYPNNNYIANNIVVHNSGKSSFMCIMLADAQKKGYLPVIIDAEGAWTRDFVSRWGLDDTNVIKLQSMWVDDIMVNISEWISAGYEKLAIAIDSIGALDVRKLLDDGAKGDIKTDMGKLQREIKRMLKMLVTLCKTQNCICFSAGHFYGNSSGYGDVEQIGGGKYYRLSCDQIISLKKSPIYENPNASGTARGKVLGNSIKVATLKNRTYPPFQEATLHIDFKNGVNSLAGIVDLAMNLDIIIKGGSWYTCDLLGIKAQGEAKLMEELNNVDVTPLLTLIDEELTKTGYSSVNRNLEMAEKIVAEESLSEEGNV